VTKKPPAPHGIRPFKRAKTAKCRRCSARIEIKTRGRPSSFCSRSCRQRAYERRKWQRPHALELLARDLAAVQIHDVIREEIWNILQQMGLERPSTVPPNASAQKNKPKLRLVESESKDPSESS